MSKGGSLAMLGFARSDAEDALICNRELVVTKDVRVDGEAIVGGDLAVTEDLTVCGELRTPTEGDLVLCGYIPDASAANSRFTMVAPCNLVIHKVYGTPLGNIGGDNVTIKAFINAVNIDGATEILEFQNDNAGVVETHTAVVYPQDKAYVAEGDYIEFRVDNDGADAYKICIVALARRA
jgi:hypothetical protein